MITATLLRVLAETPLWAVVASALALIVVFAEVGIILLAAALERRGRRKSERLTAASASAGARCAVIVPSRGLTQSVECNFATVLRQDWPAYEAYFVVEAESDPGAPVLKALCASNRNAHLVVAGQSSTCSQKIHNLLAGVAAAGEVDLLAFADNDIPLPQDWLASLAAPLTDPRITVTTGFWRIQSSDSSFAVQLQVFFNRLLYSHFLTVSSLAGSFLWGGSFAMRKVDFEALGVADRWAESVSDDMSLGRMLAAARRKSRLIPGFLMVSGETFASTSEAVRWFSRQVMNLKANFYNLWLLGLTPLCLMLAGGYLVALLAVFRYFFSALSFWSCGGLVTVLVLGGELVIAGCSGLPGTVEGRWRLVARIHLFRFCFLAACLMTLGKKYIHWAGVGYRIDRQGRAVEIHR
ncbi:glycosyltransferase family 2 protein [bacterium]|nr:glycosyltransferase family 2 protein [bacterium]